MSWNYKILRNCLIEHVQFNLKLKIFDSLSFFVSISNIFRLCIWYYSHFTVFSIIIHIQFTIYEFDKLNLNIISLSLLYDTSIRNQESAYQRLWWCSQWPHQSRKQIVPRYILPCSVRHQYRSHDLLHNPCLCQWKHSKCISSDRRKSKHLRATRYK